MPCKKDRADTLGVGPAVTQVLMLIALLAGPFFFLGDLALENGIRLVILFALFQATGHFSKHLYSGFAGGEHTQSDVLISLYLIVVVRVNRLQDFRRRQA
jgi:hypothetical protein